MKSSAPSIFCKRKDDGSLFDLKNDSAESIAVAIAGKVSPHQAEASGRNR